MELLLALIISGLFAGGVYMLLRRSLVKLVIGLILLGHGANLFIFLMGRLGSGQAPLIPLNATQPVEPFADPLPQALVLTAIVIGFGLQAFALVLVSRLHQVSGADDMDQLRTTDGYDAGTGKTAAGLPVSPTTEAR
jgi:multicomponent Na+:H+ antiporter subunit C